MQLNSSILKTIQTDFPAINFIESDTFEWVPLRNTIYYNHDDASVERLLHEVAHAILKHTSYESDIELLAMECDAWQHAAHHLAPRYNLVITQDLVEDDLDSYRDWLHTRSTCPNCSVNGVQIDTSVYACIVCEKKWTVNQAITTQLRRYGIKTAPV